VTTSECSCPVLRGPCYRIVQLIQSPCSEPRRRHFRIIQAHDCTHHHRPHHCFFFIIIVVLLQSRQSGGHPRRFWRTGQSDPLVLGRASALSKATTWSAVAFMVTSITCDLRLTTWWAGFGPGKVKSNAVRLSLRAQPRNRDADSGGACAKLFGSRIAVYRSSSDAPPA